MMANPGELVATLAAALGLPEATLISHDRALRDAGLRTKGGRGNAAPDVTPGDAARQTVSVLGSGRVQDSVNTVRRYAETRARLSASSEHGFTKTGIPELVGLPETASFIDALEQLIAAAASGSLAAAAWKEKGASPSLREIAPLIEVAAQTPGTVGEIRIAGLQSRRTAHVIYALPDPRAAGKASAAELAAWEKQVGRFRLEGDLSQQRRVTARTIVLLGELLSSK